jgi:hypothetical protein
VIEPERREALKANGITFPADSFQSEPVKLILSTPESYVFLPESESSVIEIQRESVHMVIYESIVKGSE